MQWLPFTGKNATVTVVSQNYFHFHKDSDKTKLGIMSNGPHLDQNTALVSAQMSSTSGQETNCTLFLYSTHVQLFLNEYVVRSRILNDHT